VTATVDSYRADLPAIVEHFLSLGFLQIELTERYGSADPVVSPRECAASCAGESEGPDLEGGVKSGEGGAGLEGDVRAVEENYRRVAEILYGRLRSRQYANIIPFHDPLLFLHARRRNRYPCRTGLDSAALFTDGLFYPCHHFMGDGQFAAGDLDSGPSWEKLRAIRRHVMARERCAGCWCRFLCGGECYHRSMVEGEGLYSGFERGCARRKALYRQAIILYHRLRTDDPECLDWYLSVSLYP